MKTTSLILGLVTVLNASTVLNADPICDRSVGNCHQDRSDEGMGFLRLGGSRGPTRANRPAGFVGYDYFG